MALTYNNAFEAKMRERLEIGRKNTHEELENGLSQDAYQQRVGYLRAIRFMEDECDEIHKELEEH